VLDAELINGFTAKLVSSYGGDKNAAQAHLVPGHYAVMIQEVTVINKLLWKTFRVADCRIGIMFVYVYVRSKCHLHNFPHASRC
jgi:hypothetical protein